MQGDCSADYEEVGPAHETSLSDAMALDDVLKSLAVAPRVKLREQFHKSGLSYVSWPIFTIGGWTINATYLVKDTGVAATSEGVAMYGRTVDDFEYRGVPFRWTISPNRLIYRVYHESELIGGIPVSQVRLRHSREAIKFLYPICDSWLEVQVDEPIADGATEETREEYLTRKTEEVRESFRALQRLEDRAVEGMIEGATSAARGRGQCMAEQRRR